MANMVSYKFLHSVVIWSDSVGDIHLCEGTICPYFQNAHTLISML